VRVLIGGEGLAARLSVYDVIVVGGGPAGLSAALMLGRCRRKVLVCDRGEPRNRRSNGLHGYLTRDGVRPLDFNALGRRELAPYGIELRPVSVSSAVRRRGSFLVSLADGARAHARFLLLATGVADELPKLDGIADCYGRSVFHCPYCDGWEWRDRKLAVLGSGRKGAGLALALRTWSSDVRLCTRGNRIPAEARGRLARNGISMITTPIRRLEHRRGLLTRLVLRDGSQIPVDAIFFTTGQHPQDDLAARLGCTFTPHGTVNTGRSSETNVPGVFVAGDASRDAQFVVVAASEGVKAAVAINQALQRSELRP
jgi:thioredoxin reductase